MNYLLSTAPNYLTIYRQRFWMHSGEVCVCMLMLACGWLHMHCAASRKLLGDLRSNSCYSVRVTGRLNSWLAGPLLFSGRKEELQESSFVSCSSTYLTCLHTRKEKPAFTNRSCWIFTSLFSVHSLFSPSFFFSCFSPSHLLFLFAVLKKASVMPNSRCLSYT